MASSDRERFARLVANASVEMSTKDLKALDVAKAHLKPGAQVNMTWLATDTLKDRIAAAVALREAGFEPTPHIAARFLPSEADLRTLVKALREEADVRKVFCIAGDVDKVAGPFPGALDVMMTDILPEGGITEVGFSLYPEGHPAIADATLDAQLQAKLDWARSADVTPFLCSQLCFDAEAIAASVRRVRALGSDATVRVGLSGPASITGLLKFAARCGVGQSTRFLTRRPAALGQILMDSTPDELVGEIAAVEGFDSLGEVTIHIFTFGGLTKTVKWLETAQGAKVSA